VSHSLDQMDYREVDDGYMLRIITLLNRMFFFGATGTDMGFASKTDVESLERCYGYMESFADRKGRIGHKMLVHPTKLCMRLQTTRAPARVGFLLHEMLHAFLFELRVCLS
jgi:hypothetical protein